MERWLCWRWWELLRLDDDDDDLALDLDGTSDIGGEGLPEKDSCCWSKEDSGRAIEMAALVRDRLPVLMVVWLVLLLRRCAEVEVDADADADTDDEEENGPADEDAPVPPQVEEALAEHVGLWSAPPCRAIR